MKDILPGTDRPGLISGSVFGVELKRLARRLAEVSALRDGVSRLEAPLVTRQREAGANGKTLSSKGLSRCPQVYDWEEDLVF